MPGSLYRFEKVFSSVSGEFRDPICDRQKPEKFSKRNNREILGNLDRIQTVFTESSAARQPIAQ